MRNLDCSRCGQEKEDKYKTNGSYCKKCSVERVREYENQNPEKYKQMLERFRLKKQTQKCIICNNVFIRNRGEKVCSIKCKLISYSKINDSGCWIYPTKNSKGYSQFNFRGEKGLGHRISYREFKGKLEPSLCVCHKCDTPQCVNPDHLFLGTYKENIADGINKGRIKHIGRKGSVEGWTKLTDIQISQARLLYSEGFKVDRLSRIFNCEKEYMRKIIKKMVRI